jgi:hypothetical protein
MLPVTRAKARPRCAVVVRSAMYDSRITDSGPNEATKVITKKLREQINPPKKEEEEDEERRSGVRTMKWSELEKKWCQRKLKCDCIHIDRQVDQAGEQQGNKLK